MVMGTLNKYGSIGVILCTQSQRKKILLNNTLDKLRKNFYCDVEHYKSLALLLQFFSKACASLLCHKLKTRELQFEWNL